MFVPIFHICDHVAAMQAHKRAALAGAPPLNRHPDSDHA